MTVDVCPPVTLPVGFHEPSRSGRDEPGAPFGAGSSGGSGSGAGSGSRSGTVRLLEHILDDLRVRLRLPVVRPDPRLPDRRHRHDPDDPHDQRVVAHLHPFPEYRRCDSNAHLRDSESRRSSILLRRSDPGRTRTCDRQVRNLPRYPLRYRVKWQGRDLNSDLWLMRPATCLVSPPCSVLAPILWTT